MCVVEWWDKELRKKQTKHKTKTKPHKKCIPFQVTKDCIRYL